MKVFLIGYMGVGKTTLGKKIATKLGLRFLDLDQIIESSEESTISEIFKLEGESYFRNAESEKLIETIETEQNFVLSTGGGTPIMKGNMEKMLQAGIVVWLKMDAKQIASRLSQSENKRPLLEGLGLLEILDFVEIHVAERLPMYIQAHIHFSAIQNDASHINMLCKEIQAYSK